MSEIAVETIETPEDLEALPDFTIVVSDVAQMEGSTVCIALQKIGGDWYAPGTAWPIQPDELSAYFWPGKVVFRL
jgi:hypothetical protein